ncbi:MAG: alkaline phosphatase family protein [Myxococcota bacterium]|nr:alkaline phosphatase family protein [Myxococcota bacterium]
MESGLSETGSDTSGGEASDSGRETGSTDERTPKVLMVMIDGFIPEVISLTQTPAMDQLLVDSAWSMKARAESTTISGSGWATFLTGVHWDKHGVPDNAFAGTNFETYPHVFVLAREALPGVELAGCQSWEPIEVGLVEPSLPEHHSFYDYYEYSDDYFDEQSPDRYCSEDVAKWAAESDAGLFVLMFGDPDGVGHGYGYGAEYPTYQEEISEVDGFLMNVLQAIEGRSTREQEDWLIVLTGDHAGEPTLHHGANIPSHREMPLIIGGDSVVAGEIWPPPKAADVVPTVLDHLGVDLQQFQHWDLDGRVLGKESSARPFAELRKNLLFNGDAEFERGYSNYVGVPDASIPGWNDPGYLTVIRYDAPDGFPRSSDAGPEDRGDGFFAGGGVSSDTQMSQRVDVSNLGFEIDSGVNYTLGAHLGGYADQGDRAVLSVRFLGENGEELGNARVGPVRAVDRGGSTGLLERETTGVVPQGTRLVEATLQMLHSSGYNDGYADNLSLVFSK